MEVTTPPVPGAPETAAIPVLVADAGRHGVKICSSTPRPAVFAGTHIAELMVPDITPVRVFVTLAFAVALARIE